MADGTRFETRNPTSGYQLIGNIVVKEPSDKRICVLVHGLVPYCHRNKGIIKKLSEILPNNTCRFDLSGAGESEGPFRYAGYERELGDLRTIVEYLRREGWLVHAIVGHSKGAHCCLRYSWTYDDVPMVVSLSARFHFKTQPTHRHTPEMLKDMQEKGSMVWRVEGGEYIISRQDLDERDATDNTMVQNIKHSQVLLVHGDADAMIPVQDVYEYERWLVNCPHSLHILKGGTHFYPSPEEQGAVVDLVVGSWDKDKA